MKRLKIEQIELNNGKIIYTIHFKSHTEEQKQAQEYLKSINAIQICTTYLENGKGYIDYYIGDKENENIYEKDI